MYFSFCEIRPLFVIAAGPGGQRSWLISLGSLPSWCLPGPPFLLSQVATQCLVLDTRITQSPQSPSLSSDNIELRQDLFTLDTPVQNLLNIDWNHLLLLLHLLNKQKKYKKKMCCFLPTLLYLPSIANRLSLWSRYDRAPINKCDILYRGVVCMPCFMFKTLSPPHSKDMPKTNPVGDVLFDVLASILWIGDWSCTIDQLDNRGQIWL